MSARVVTRAGAVLFALWGLLHVAGGAAMLVSLSGQGADGLMALVATSSRIPALPEGALGPLAGVLGQHAWDLLVVGFMVTVIAVTMNWKGSRAGFWLNTSLVSGVDVGLTLFMVVPGVMNLADALPGVVLWIPAVALSAWGLAGSSGSRV